MVARPGQYQASFNSGELGPDVWGRNDIKQFYSGASLMQNAEPVPQGGFEGLPGSLEIGFVRGDLADVSTSQTPSYGPHGGPATLLSGTFASAFICMIDLNGFSGNHALDGALIVETSNDGSNWTQIGPVANVRTATRSRRFADPPGGGRQASAFRVRLAVTPGSAFTLALASAQVRREINAGVNGRSFEHTFSLDDAYCVVLSPGNVDIWKGDVFVAATPLAGNATQIPDMAREQRFKTMLIFHRDHAPQRLTRQDNDNDWSWDVAPFENVPLVDYGETYNNVVVDKWKITILWSSGPAGLALELNVNGEDMASVRLEGAPDWGAFCDDIEAALEALPSVNPGVTVTSIVPGGGTFAEIYIDFDGAGNRGSRFTVVPKIVNVTYASATASHLEFGDPGGEAIMSSGRGWPATGNFYQDRLFLGGFKSEEAALLGSVSGEYFDLNTRIENTAGGVLVRLDTTGAERILYLARAKHLVIFTNEAEYYVSDRAIARGTVPNIAQSSRKGIAPGIRPEENDGALIYVARSRSLIYAATYSDVSQTYESEPISLLASHLAAGIRGAAMQRASESTDAARYWTVREDGLLVAGVLIRNQDVAAFVRWQTDGLTRDVVVDGANNAYVLVLRTMGGVQRLVRERLQGGIYLHQQRSFAYGSPTSVVTGLGSHEGAQVWAFCDGYVQGPFTVTGGAITLPYPATSVQVGRWTAPNVATLPVPRLVGERTVLQRPVRVHTVRAYSQGCTSLAISANGRPPQDVPLLRGGQVSDQPIQPYFGPIEVGGLFGWTDEGFVSFTQLRPGRFALRATTIEARI